MGFWELVVMDELVVAMAKAIKERESLPRMPDDLDLEQAYDVQKALVGKVAGSEIAGLKAGMTAAAGQKQY